MIVWTVLVFLAGAGAGMFITALCVAAARSDRRAAEMRQQENWKPEGHYY